MFRGASSPWQSDFHGYPCQVSTRQDCCPFLIALLGFQSQAFNGGWGNRRVLSIENLPPLRLFHFIHFITYLPT